MKSHIFVLDVDESSTHWKYVLDGNSVLDITSKCYGDQKPPELKSQYDGTTVQVASIKNCVTGVSSNGTIYKVMPVATVNTVLNTSAKINKSKLSARSLRYFLNKSKNKISLIGLLLILFFSSCRTPKLTNRYKVKSDTTGFMAKYVDVKGYALSIPAVAKVVATPLTSLNFTEKGQKALIEELSKNVKEPDKLIKLLGTSLIEEKEAAAPSITYKTKFSKRLVLSVRNKSAYPEDRISKIEVNLTGTPAQFKFLGCDKIATEYQTVDQGKLTFKNNISGEINAGLTSGVSGTAKRTSKIANPKTGDTADFETTGTTNNTASLGGKLGFNSEFTEEANLRQRYVSLSGSITASEASFYQESIGGIDLSGNIIADVEFELYPGNQATWTFYKFDSLFRKSSPVRYDSILIKRSYTIIPNIPVATSTIDLNLSYHVVFRKVIDGGKTTIEGDDKIEFVKLDTVKNNSVILINRDEVIPKRWSIKDAVAHYLIISPTANYLDGTPLYFQNYKDAQDFLDWIKRTNNPGSNVITLEGLTLFIGNANLNNINRAALYVAVE